MLGKEGAASLTAEIKEEWMRIIPRLLQLETVDRRELIDLISSVGAFEAAIFGIAAANGVPVRDALVARHTAESSDWLTHLHAQIATDLLYDSTPSTSALEILGELGYMLDEPMVSRFARTLLANELSLWWPLVREPWIGDIDQVVFRNPERGRDLDEAVESWRSSASFTTFFDASDPWYAALSILAFTKLDLAWRVDKRIFCELVDSLPLPGLMRMVVDRAASSLGQLFQVIAAAGRPYEQGRWRSRFVGVAAGKIALERLHNDVKTEALDDDVRERIDSTVQQLLDWDTTATLELGTRLKWELIWTTRLGTFGEREKALSNLYWRFVALVVEADVSPLDVLVLPTQPAHTPLLRFLGSHDLGVIGGRNPERDIMSFPHALFAADLWAEEHADIESDVAEQLISAVADALADRDPGLELFGVTHADLLRVPHAAFGSLATLIAGHDTPSTLFSSTLRRLSGQIHRYRFGEQAASDLGVLMPTAWWVRANLEACACLVGAERKEAALTLWNEIFRACLVLWHSEPTNNPFSVDAYVAICFAYLPHIAVGEELHTVLGEPLRSIVTSPYLRARALRFLAQNRAIAKEVVAALVESGMGLDEVIADFDRRQADQGFEEVKEWLQAAKET